jgi:hypothetical protein
MHRIQSVLLVAMMLAIPVVVTASPGSAKISHYTTHATGMFNQDEYEDMIITSSTGSAFLLLGTGSGYDWLHLEELSDSEAPEGWPDGSHLFVRQNGGNFDVFTRDTRGKVHRFSTARIAEVRTS